MIKKIDQVTGPDGLVRPAAQENHINEAFFETFKGASAERVLNYLRSITLNIVNGPEASDAAIRHREGMRDLMRIINARIETGEVNYRTKVETNDG
tara:strand:- start:413 stop:700 length:288 start_codon:yes stop_codon:yes gene_type:complete